MPEWKKPHLNVEAENLTFQQKNRLWWERNPMQYDWDRPLQESPGTKSWFEEIDARFFQASFHLSDHSSGNTLPFSRLVNWDSLSGCRVLEIGCGMGSHASLFASAGATYVGLDLTWPAVHMTARRFQLFSQSGPVVQADAEDLCFPDNSFDLVWSWGVVMFTSNMDRLIGEIHRVLRPNGVAKVMVYHRNSTRYWVYNGFYRGLLKGRLFRSPLEEVNSEVTDGYIARHLTQAELGRLFREYSIVDVHVLPEAQIPTMFPGWGRLSRRFPHLLEPLNRWLGQHFGWFLFAEAVK